MSEEMSSKHITKLNGSNYQTWKFQVKQILVAFGIWDIVTGERLAPKDADSKAAKLWVKENAKAMFLISSSVQTSQLECLLTCTLAAEMWSKLSAIHEQKSESNKLLLAQRFHEYKMAPDDSVVKHVTKVQNMAQQLADVGEVVSDVTIMAKILASLPSQYNSLKTAWDNVAPKYQTIDNLLERLIKEESRQKEVDEAASAMAAMSTGVGKKKTGQKTNTRVNQTTQQQGKKANVVCFYCRRRGHYESECRTKLRDYERETDDQKSSESCATQ